MHRPCVQRTRISVAHILQLRRKTDLLNSYFKQSFKENVIESATRYVVNYCKRYGETSDIPLLSKPGEPLDINHVKKSKFLKAIWIPGPEHCGIPLCA
ncbi:uncharacterized protein KLLA0_F02610g [Kluyveromyces lactis]|uniref:KLLA0F02610p n=1 Tax=Kluyveromyces lactis (strain ATCC 8585 / CBS 2359 / DSM 70799 / NBRC 1267 / NRRL Y-1140 / WM37) TaxID=284590 RepID=B5FV95_KLULA|nr:uncharacterized protein KLLA0_F02610g [Kluyveromyces lactis]CAR64390.1 KLLA0F02610p [Kluyveromyces lactis]|eukprot:XP_002999424.1 uncharacterized protein KLLA0_F02610g [Kluyveromyces lactis]